MRLTRQEIEQEIANARRYALGNFQPDLTKLLLIYARQSSSRQYVSNVYSALEQSEGLLERSNDMGWTRDEMKRLFVENNLIKKLHVSGSLRIDQRPGLQAIAELIDPTGICAQWFNPENENKLPLETVKKLARAACKVSAVLVVDVARITRDPDLITPTQFATMCMLAGVVIITEERVFDFNNPNRDDMGDFMKEAIASKEYVRKQIKGKMLKARTRKAGMGLLANGVAPVGLTRKFELNDAGILKGDNLMPSPHSERVNWLYARYRAHDANLSSLYHEIVNMALRGEPLFPVVAGIDPKTIFLKEVFRDGQLVGWTIGSRDGLKYILSNPMYAGHLVFNGRIVKRNAHVAIVKPIDNWHYAFDHLATVDLDGNTIERETKTIHYKSGKTVERPIKAIRYTQQGSTGNTALLAGVRDNGKAVIDGLNGAHVHVQLPHNTYTLRQMHEISASGYEASIVIKELDSAIEKRLLYWLAGFQETAKPEYGGLPFTMFYVPDEKGKYHEHTHTPLDMVEAVDKTDKQPSGVSSIQGDLALTNADLARVERALKTSQDVMDDKELRETYASKSRLLKRRAELEQAQEKAERIQREQAGAKDDIEHGSEKWAKWDLEKRRQFIRLVTDCIALEAIADGWLRLTIVWSPLMGFVTPMESNIRAVEVAYLWRPSGSFWTDDEVQLLRDLYPTASKTELQNALPARSFIAMRHKASVAVPRIQRTVREVDDAPNYLSLSDIEVIKAHDLDPALVKSGAQWKHEYRVCESDDLSRCFCELTVFAA